MTIKNRVLFNLLVLLTFTLTGFLIYSNIFQNEFVFDDINNIRENTHVVMGSLSIDSLRNAASGGRPVATLTFAFNHLFHGFNVWGFHFVNIVIHIINSILLFFLFTAILGLIEKKTSPVETSLSKKNKDAVPFFAALLWLVHPLQTQSVTYIVQRMNSLSALFFMLAILFYLSARKQVRRGHKIIFFVFCAGAFVLSVGSKENGLMLPFLLLLIELCFFESIGKEQVAKYWKFIAGGGVISFCIVALWLGAGRIDLILTGYDTYDFSLPQRLLTEFRVVLMYLTLIVFPWPGRLHLDYNFPISYSLFEPVTTFFAMVIIGVLLIYSVLCFRKDSRFYSHSKLTAFAILWYFLNLLIESTFIPIELVYEHRVYLPSMFLFLIFTEFIINRIKNRYIPIISLIIIALIFSGWTYKRNFVWKDRVTVWRDNIAKLPPKARTYSNFGTALMNEKRYEEAIVYLKKAIRLNPGHYPSHNNYGYALYKLGRYQDALSYFQVAINIKNDYPLAYQNWGDALQKLGKRNEALLKYLKAISYKSNSSTILNRVAMIYATEKDYLKAAAYFEKIHALQPEKAAVCYNIVCMYSLADDKDMAVKWLDKAISLGYRKWENILNDRDLDNIRSTDFYKKIVKDRY